MAVAASVGSRASVEAMTAATVDQAVPTVHKAVMAAVSGAWAGPLLKASVVVAASGLAVLVSTAATDCCGSWRINPDPKFVAAVSCRRNAPEALVHGSNGARCPRHPSNRGGASEALEGTESAAGGQG